MGVIVTREEKGCIFGKNGEVISIPTVDLVERGLKKVNTVGAGDALTGGHILILALWRAYS